MLKVGKVYLTEDKTRFLILAKKSRASSNGCDFVGEHLGSGFITYFNYKGEHPWRPTWKLKADPYRWCGVFHEGELSADGFVIREKLEREFPGYLRMEDDNPTTIIYVTRANLETTYV